MLKRSFKRILLLFIFYSISIEGLCASSFSMERVQLTPDDRVLILAPHPDDEVLGTGGIIQSAVRMQLPIKLVFFTNGDSNQWSFFYYRKYPVIIPGAVRTMGLVRRDEAVAASSILGLDPKDMIFLGYPDFGTLGIWYRHWDKRPALKGALTRVKRVPYKGSYREGTPYKGEEIVADLRSILRKFKPTKIFVSHPSDQNGDHISLYLFLKVAIWDERLESSVEVYSYLVHYNGWPNSKELTPQDPLLPPVKLKTADRWKEYRLDQKEFDLKKTALQAHRSQYNSNRKYLLSFVRYNEIFESLPEIKLYLNEQTTLFTADRDLKGMPNFSNQDDSLMKIKGTLLQIPGKDLILSIELSKPLASHMEALIYLFGYNSKKSFEKMPKISLRLGNNSFSIFDQSYRLDQGLVRINRTPSEIKFNIPWKVLGEPERILTHTRAYLNKVPLDSGSWMAVEPLNVN